MAELAVTRNRYDRRVYEVEDIGSIRLGGLFARGARRGARCVVVVRSSWGAEQDDRGGGRGGDRGRVVRPAGDPAGSRSTTSARWRPGLLLFAAYVVRRLVEDADSAAGAASSTAAVG
jgi:hypothetical protein